ncbi:hypothetical protein GCM10012275_42740 [Longimycelium tulufanense]|uniref:DUF7715 domain-containing protein n=1 Tax=Longimycelium tulufanense TaxID=907463 RepID=A0A8J3FVE7_9PSEU|nr:hypothetical protein [Longimycelium tulufanense]GGM67622.1 hypothetical protein GCM10012275_42740 [Longimycelium tulufanense]
MPMLKVLAATDRTQGQRPTDLHSATTGELVELTTTCDRDRDNPDGSCGCARAFTGLTSGKATTTAEVVERDLTVEQHTAALHDSLRRAGWNDNPNLATHAGECAAQIRALAAAWPTGTVIERRGNRFTVRAEKAHPTR